MAGRCYVRFRNLINQGMDVPGFEIDEPSLQIVSHYAHSSELRFNVEPVGPCYSAYNCHPCDTDDSVCYSDNEAFVPILESNLDPLSICFRLRGGHETFYFFDVILHADIMLESMVERSVIDVELPDVPVFLRMFRYLILGED